MFLDRGMELSQPYKDACLSSSAVQMSSFCCPVGFFIRTVDRFLFFFVEKNDLIGCSSLFKGSFFVVENDFPRFCLAFIRFQADIMYDLIPLRVSLSSTTCSSLAKCKSCM